MNTVLPYLYLLRFPLLCGLLLASFGPLAGGSAASLLGGMFDLDARGVFVAAYFAFWVAAACFFSTRLVLEYGHLRFGVAKPSGWFARRRFRGRTQQVELLFGAAYACAAITLVWCLAGAARPGRWVSLACAAVGLVGFAATVGLLAWIGTKASSRWSKRVAAYLAFTPSGYMIEPQYGLLPGHGIALTVSIGSLLLYLALGISKGFTLLSSGVRIGPAQLPQIPTLVCVLLLIMVVCWTASALAFFFDRFRTPVLAVLLVLVVVASRWPQSDQFFAVTNAQERRPLLPAAVLGAHQGDSAIVIAVSGGGIQAAAWSAQVLKGLQEESRGKFSGAVRLLSCVSGGCVGTMHFLAAYKEGAIPESALPDIFNHSAASSLDDVAWGLIYPDLLRFVAPFFMTREIGRGWALEHAWSAGRQVSAPLSDWRPAVAAGQMPAVMFNSTVVETGERVVFSTVDPRSTEESRSARTFYDIYPDLDVAPVTAARLSATFPYVTPAARANADLPKSRRYHFVDGGYWDNFGVASAIGFIRQATFYGAPPVKRILLLEIRDRKSGGSDAAGGSRGSLFQAIAPVAALYNVRGNGQATRNEMEIDLLRRSLAPVGVTLSRAAFECPQAEAPLSWHLRPREIEDIKTSWSIQKDPARIDKDLCTTLDFLGANPYETACRTALSR